MGLPDHLYCLLRNLYEVKKQQLEPDMEQQPGSKLGKEYVKAVYCHTAYSTYMQSISYDMLGWDEVQVGLEIARGNITNLRYADDTTLMTESKEELKSLLMKVIDESEKADPEGWYGEGGGRRVQDGEHMYFHFSQCIFTFSFD